MVVTVKRETCNSAEPLETAYIPFFHLSLAPGKENRKSCVILKRCERWHLWCWRLMHVDRPSTKNHDMLTMQLCIGSVFWLHRVGHQCTRLIQWLFRNVTNMHCFEHFGWDRLLSDCFPIEGLWKQEVCDNSIDHSSSLFSPVKAKFDFCCVGEFFVMVTTGDNKYFPCDGAFCDASQLYNVSGSESAAIWTKVMRHISPHI